MSVARTSSGGPTETPSPTGPGSAADVALWQDTLAAEHTVIWAFGLVGATGELAAPAEGALDVHRRRRAICLDAVAALGAEPVASAAAYDLAKPTSTAEARQLAAELESAASSAYLGLTSSADRSTRLVGARWLRESAVAQQRWSGSVPSLPGFEVQ